MVTSFNSPHNNSIIFSTTEERMKKTLTVNMLLPFLPVIIIQLAAFGAAALQNFPVAEPKCLDSCNGIDIPFPFGTNESCYHSRGFWVTCNESLNNPPRLFWQDSSVEIKSILLSGQMLVMQFIAYDYDYLPNGTKFYNNPSIKLAGNFTVNSTGNKFTVVGCDAFGTIYGLRHGRNYTTGCTATCGSLDDLVKDSCSGSGCCQTSIPPDATAMYIKVGSINNYTEVKSFSDATFGFFVEVNSFKFAPDNLTNLRKVEKMPMLLDWAIGNSTCEDAEKTSSEYACKSTKSRCYKPETGDGYRCRCEDGYDGNPYLIDGCKDIDECQLKKCKHRCVNTEGSFHCRCPRWYHGDGKVDGTGCKLHELFIVRIVTGTASGIILLLLGAWFVSIQLNMRRMRQMFLEDFGGKRFLDELEERGMTFTKSDLDNATNNFHKDNIIANESYGRLYKGKLSNGTEVSIKEAKYIFDQHVDPCINEAMVLFHITHPHAVKLIGCSVETYKPHFLSFPKKPHFVYEFISNGELYWYIHDNKKAPLFDWDRRLKIASETAQLLSFLHFEASPRIIHGDIKSLNILLDGTFTAKVANFGAARKVHEDQTSHSGVVIGTRGYIDPEFEATKKLTPKSDVYSFGVVLFELLTGKLPISVDGRKQENEVERFNSVMQQESKCENLFQLVYAEIVPQGNKEQIIKVAEIAECCLKPKGEDRPNMKDVEKMLDDLRCGKNSLAVKTEGSKSRMS